jgi:pyruvate dehydrogenase E2 component (dihydrolipoamide acetyltransferase)
MSINILMPSVGAGANEGRLLQWRKHPGDPVTVGEVIAEIETEKAVVELEALDAGTLDRILVEAGTSDIPVGSIIGVLAVGGERSSVSQRSFVTASVSEGLRPAPVTVSLAPQLQDIDASARAPQQSARSHFASPSARMRARQLGVDMSELVGTGPKGRIVRVDVERHAGSAGMNGHGAPLSPPADAPPAPTSSRRVTPLSPMRKAIARRLLESKQSIPHFYLKVDCEVTQLQTVRSSLNLRLRSSGVEEKITINDLIVFGVSRALVDVPEMNARWTDDGIETLETVDVGVAVSKQGGLVTPVVRAASSRGLRDMSREIKRLTSAAKQGRLKLLELEGGCLTVSNLGMYGVDEFAAIINPPQSAILAVGQVRDRLKLDAGGVVQMSQVMTLTLSADHRVIDGALGARFLASLKCLIEAPSLLLL